MARTCCCPSCRRASSQRRISCRPRKIRRCRASKRWITVRPQATARSRPWTAIRRPAKSRCWRRTLERTASPGARKATARRSSTAPRTPTPEDDRHRYTSPGNSARGPPSSLGSQPLFHQRRRQLLLQVHAPPVGERQEAARENLGRDDPAGFPIGRLRGLDDRAGIGIEAVDDGACTRPRD